MFPHEYLFKPVNKWKPAQGRCHHWRCRRVPRPGRKDCYTCDARKARLRNPVRYAFKNLKASAAKRGIAFLLTFDQFAQWAKDTNYVALRGKDDTSLSCDRRDTNGPYSIDNIRIMTYAENVSHVHECGSEPADY